MHLLFHLAVFLSLAHLGSSVKCYQCVGEKGRNVSDVNIACFKSGGHETRECPFGCLKVTTEFHREASIKRTCAPEKVEKDECVTKQNYDKVDECRCKEDLCNDAIGIPPALVTTAALLSLLAVVYQNF
ncbi:unnamed protein product [Bursaphelenchus xylophilus]|uniref:(pine wood nematode) hypothetical protein n=1 Tax=Bursaphelenchus xylophilus TaxID=6326 RepID=A0A1I7SHS9_BURXY|nr:unnamed protein product [Bursaphelenchus xylophilus]CAG9100787.1 unnamed protein product [Bursaphelenchus xylophilus]